SDDAAGADHHTGDRGLGCGAHLRPGGGADAGRSRPVLGNASQVRLRQHVPERARAGPRGVFGDADHHGHHSHSVGYARVRRRGTGLGEQAWTIPMDGMMSGSVDHAAALAGPQGRKPRNPFAASRILVYSVLILAALFYLFPLYIMVITSLK